MVSKALVLAIFSFLFITVVKGQENIKPCECIPCGGQIQCQLGSTSWCECRSYKCYGGCLPPDRNPRRVAASVVAIITDAEVEIPPESLQQDPQRFAELLQKLLDGKTAEGTYRIEYEDREINFVLSGAAITQIIEVQKELNTGLPSPSPSPSHSPSPSRPRPERVSRPGIWELIKGSGWASSIAFGILGVMSLYLILIALERFVTYTNLNTESQKFASRIGKAFQASFHDAFKLSEQSPRSPVGIVVYSGLQELAAYDRLSDIPAEEFELSRHAMQRAIALETERLKRGLSSLAAISAAAPRIGLAASIFGLIYALRRASTAVSIDNPDAINVFLIGLAFLAFGIATGLCAKWLNIYFTNRVNDFVVEMNDTTSKLEHAFPTMSETVAKSNVV